MGETWYCLYHCYGLALDSGTEAEMMTRENELRSMENGEAGTDGRKLKFYCRIPKKDFMSFLSRMME